ncbi:hypothetical protein FRC07_006642 [Ceratobasidium sp. 392]|nr:hypothetical protein FRC07_006642 [Ceratobasidium sp. 392]
MSSDRSTLASFLDCSTATNDVNHTLEVVEISDEEESSVPPTIAHILHMLQNELSQPVFLSLSCLHLDLEIAPPPVLIHEPDRAELTTSELLQEVDRIFESWIALPCPSFTQITDLEKQLRFIPSIEHASYSVQVSHPTRTLCLPVFFLNCYPTLSTLKRYCMAWSNAIAWLNSLSGLDGRFSHLSLECMQRMTLVPLHQKHPAIPDFFSSDLSLLLSSAWLTDAQINAAGDYINSHLGRTPHLRVLHSHFLGSLALYFNPSRPWSPRRPRLIDRLLADGQITQLLIPVYQHRHWSFIFGDLTLNTYVHTDTLHLESTRAPDSCIQLLNWWLSSVLNRPVVLTNVPRMFDVTPQTDGHSCGVAVMTSMAHIALSSRFTSWSQESTTGERMDWFLRLSEGLILSPILDEYPVFDVDFDDLIQPGFSAIVPFTCFDSKDGFVNVSLDFDTASSIPTPSSPSLIDIDSSSDIEFLDNDSPSRMPSPCALAFDMDLDAPDPFGTPSPQRASSHCSSLTQSILPFKSISREEWIIQERTRWEETREQRMIDAETERLQADRKKAKQKAYERIKKQAQRARCKALRAQLESRSNSNPIKTKSGTDSPCTTSSSIAETSRPHRAFTRIQKQQRKVFEKRGRKATREATNASRVNWVNPLIWPQIDATARSVGYPWSAAEIVHRLQQQNMSLFGPLRPQRISQWRDLSVTHKLQWTSQHLRNVEAAMLSKKPSNRPQILGEYPHIVASIVAHLKELCDAGVPLSVARIWGYMVGVIKHEAPHLFNPTPSGTPGFTCSISFVQKFLHSELGWSPRRATRAAQKLPADFDRLLLRAFLRMACLV